MQIEPPLLELFTRLRDSGVDLGIDQYVLLVRALQGGYGLATRDSLARLCRTLWIKTPEEERLFADLFRQYAHANSSRLPDEGSYRPSREVNRPTEDTHRLGEPDAKEAPHDAGDYVIDTVDEIQALQAQAISLGMGKEETEKFFALRDEYFPVTRRQMKQSWRFLRRPLYEGPPTELVVDRTVAEFERQGVLLDVVLSPPRVNRAELLLLMDEGGSMVPFQPLSRRLVDTALRGGRLGRTGAYYFRNVPNEYVYKDRAHRSAVSLEQLIQRLNPASVSALIFSDAGAARGSLSTERIDATYAFLAGVTRKSRYVAWLNPVPRARWAGTSAAVISRVIPMFEMTRRSLDSAIDVLRGRHTYHGSRSGGDYHGG